LNISLTTGSEFVNEGDCTQENLRPAEIFRNLKLWENQLLNQKGKYNRRRSFCSGRIFIQ
jgi:hypothetical protein